jgi:predicted 3-demethylubiquinone-9 3-methyltransferase (glyoxalase superfamily)
MPQIHPCLWFDNQAEDAANFYCSVFPNSKILSILRNDEGGPGPAGSALMVEFELDGRKASGLNGGPIFPQTEAFSFVIECDSQEQVDRYWDGLQAGGGKPSQCGWLKDRYGVSWQVFPKRLEELIGGSDPGVSSRAMDAMMAMGKIDLAKIEEAAHAPA